MGRKEEDYLVSVRLKGLHLIRNNIAQINFFESISVEMILTAHVHAMLYYNPEKYTIKF